MMRWYSNLQSVESSERVLHEDLASCKLSTGSHMAVVGGRGKEAVYASTAALHASPVVWAEMAAL